MRAYRQRRKARGQIPPAELDSVRLIRQQSCGRQCARCEEWLWAGADPALTLCGFCRLELDRECGLAPELEWLDWLTRALDIWMGSNPVATPRTGHNQQRQEGSTGGTVWHQ